jgi:uncharacterized membrane protein
MSNVPLALSFYSVSVAFHVIFALIGFGAAFCFPFIGIAAKSSPQNVPFALNVILTVMTRWVGPMAVLVLVTGIYQSVDGPYDFSDTWLGLSFVLFIVYMGVFGALMVPGTRRARDLAVEASAEPGPPPPELLSLLERNSKLGPFLGLLLVVIVFLMEAKPF